MKKMVLSSVLVAAVLAVSYRMWERSQADSVPAPIMPRPEFEIEHKPPPIPPEKSFLDEFNEQDPPSENEKPGTALSNQALERQLRSLVDVADKIAALKKHVLSLATPAEEREFELERDRLLDQYNRQAALLEKNVGLARQARPTDGVPRWLTGELLILVGGEPEEILPHLQFAIDHGIQQPRLLSSLALVQLGANRFADAYRSADQALGPAEQDRVLWTTFRRTAFSLHRFGEVADRLDRAFPANPPDWAQTMRRDAKEMQARWDAEEKLRRAEARADDLPRVRLIIEHRRFAKDKAGNPLTTIETTGRAEVTLELFENEAPKTVANFLDLTAKKFYDRTSFHLALPAMLVQGGDPNTKNDDPADDGRGSPGYVIPDEFKSPQARRHFRGSISMVNNGPHTAGSQFFICLTPQPEMDGHFTVFGRVIDGQDAVDQITRGRTTRDVGHYGKLIPGDLLVRAEVLRKRTP